MGNLVGWQDRDWARLRDEELEALYGFRKPADGRTLSTRKVVWTSTLVLTLAVFGFAYTQMPHSPRPAYVQPQQDVLYGDQTVLGICTEYVADTTGRWQCTSIELNTNHLPVARARPFDGRCAHLTVDETMGRWLCVSDRPAETPVFPQDGRTDAST
jgi:hypothetical protein